MIIKDLEEVLLKLNSYEMSSFDSDKDLEPQVENYYLDKMGNDKKIIKVEKVDETDDIVSFIVKYTF